MDSRLKRSVVAAPEERDFHKRPVSNGSTQGLSVARYRVQCEHCQSSLKASKPGRFDCPNCGRPVVITDEPASSETGTAHERSLVPRRTEKEQESPAGLDQGPADEQPSPHPHQPNRHLKQRAIIGATAGGLLLTIGIGWWMSGDEPQESAPAVPTASGSGSKNGSPPRRPETDSATDNPQTPEQALAAVPKRRDIPLFDSDTSASAGKSSRPSFTGINVSPSPSTSAPGPFNTSAAGASWAQAPWAVILKSGERPWLNGSPVLTEVGSPSSSGWPLILPAGEHVWQIGEAGPVQTRVVTRTFAHFYLEEKALAQKDGRYNFDRLAERTKPIAAAFREPVLPHLWGNYFWQENEPEAAIRFWKQAARIEPSFAPAHLNLAFAHAEQKNDSAALKALALADHCNPLDAYGIAAHIQSLQERLGIWKALDTAPFWSPLEYQPTAKVLTGEPKQVVQTLRTISQYATQPVDRIKALNNAGVYLTHRSQPEQALEPLAQALDIMVREGLLSREPALLKTLFGNLERAAKDAGLAEHRLYGWLQEASP